MRRPPAIRTPPPPAWPGRLRRGVALLLSAAMLAGLASGAAPQASRWRAGAYSFSDELGGFTIEGVSGTGLRDDPFVIRETLHSASAVTLVIRAERPIRPFAPGTLFANGLLHMRIEAHNGSGHGWVEFEFELQEIRHKPSTFGDGLSFDQRTASQDDISSDAFARFSRDFEPYDRLLFTNGKVDPGARASFSFLITDFTPKLEFYLVQDPRIPST
jgi:hypothetical protein